MGGARGSGAASEEDGSRVLIVGLGSTLRGDDALGYYYALALARCGVEGCRVEAVESPRPHDAALLGEADLVVVVDAVLEDLEPGTVVVVDGSRCTLPGSPEELVHETNACDLVALARSLGVLHGSSFVVGVVPKSLDPGPLSPEALRGLLEAHQVIESLVRNTSCRLPSTECVAAELSKLAGGRDCGLEPPKTANSAGRSAL